MEKLNKLDKSLKMEGTIPVEIEDEIMENVRKKANYFQNVQLKTQKDSTSGNKSYRGMIEIFQT